MNNNKKKETIKKHINKNTTMLLFNNVNSAQVDFDTQKLKKNRKRKDKRKLNPHNSFCPVGREL